MSHFIFDGLHLLTDGEVNIETGTSGADTLADTAGDDKIAGNAGDDTITDSLGGNDVLLGGAGDDIISISRSDAASTDTIKVQGGLGADTISYIGDAANQVVLQIDGGAGLNIINVENAFDAKIYGGSAVDTVTVSTDGYALVHTAAGDDVVNVSSVNADARTGVSTGDGADTVNLSSDNDGHYRLRLGDGADTVNQGASSDQSNVKLVFWDFQAGDGGDTLNLQDYLNSVLSHGVHQDPFATDHLRLVDGTTADGRAAAVLEIDFDGAKNGANWEKLAVFVGVSAADLTSENLGGLDPVVSTPDSHFVI